MGPPKKKAEPSTSGATTVKLRRVVPVIPATVAEKSALSEDLTSMGCAEFLNKPWGFKEELIVQELVGKRSNQYDNTIRADPSKWTEKLWREVYHIRPGGVGMASRKDEWVRGKFRGPVNPKDGFAIEDCILNRHRRILEFLLPILHPEKPTRVTISLGNTIFGSLCGERKVDWGRIIHDLVSQLVGRVGKSRATPLSPYLFHLYKHTDLLTEPEEKIWRHQEVLLKYGEATSDEEEGSESGTDPDTDGEDCEPIPPPVKKQKVASPQTKGKRPVEDKPEPSSRPTLKPGAKPKSFVGFGDPFTPVMDAVTSLRLDWESKNQVLMEVASVVGVRPDRDLASKVAECIADPVELERMQVENRELREEVNRVKAELLLANEDAVATREIARHILTLAEKVKATLGDPGESVAKARLFDAKVHEERKISGSRVLRILTDCADRMEETMKEGRAAADIILRCSHKLGRVAGLREIHLSDVSLPDECPDIPTTGDFVFSTPESKKTGGPKTRSLTKEGGTSGSGTKSPVKAPAKFSSR